MKSTLVIVQALIALLCFNDSNAFVARETRQLHRNVYRENRSLFQERQTLEKEELKTGKSAVENEESDEELSETQKLMAQVKEAGTAGVISYALWEMAFWALSVRNNSFGQMNFENLCDQNSSV